MIKGSLLRNYICDAHIFSLNTLNNDFSILDTPSPQNLEK